MKVLVSRPDKIGDVVLALHGVKQLKTMRPELQVYMHVSPYTRKLVENVKFVDGTVELGEDLEPYKFDAVVDLMAKSETARLYSRPQIQVRIGNAARWFRFRYNRTRYIRRSRALLNEAEYNWQLISLLDPGLKNVTLKEHLKSEDFKQITLPADSGYCVVMPGISASAVAWPVEQWLTLTEVIASKLGVKVYVLLGPAENKQKQAFEDLGQRLNSQVIVIDSPEFPELLGYLKNAGQYVGPSTGLTHLASALGKEGIALYPENRSMHPRRWLPFQTRLKPLSLNKKITPEAIASALAGDYPESLNPVAHTKVSAFVVCYNEERNIRRCLESIKWCDEIVVVDSGSTDRTLEIVKEYTDRVYYRKWTGHSEQKQYALGLCKCDWVLNIDSDEEVSTELKARLLKILSEGPERLNAVAGYNICRMVHFLNRWWDHGGWFPEYRLRFFQRARTRWGGVNPHEKALVSGKIRKLSEPIYHFTYSNISHQIDTLNKHSSLSASCLFKEGKRCRMHNIIFNPLFRFFKFYVMKQGFREGVPGFIVAGVEASYTLFKYIKLWELEREAQLIEHANQYKRQHSESQTANVNIDKASEAA